MAVLLGLVTLALYWPVTGFSFLNYDDPDFVTSNAHVQGGLNWEGVKWAFGPNEGDYWHPLTWLSLMLDASLFGQGAGGFHFTNVAFHAVNGVLLLLLLRMLTGALWRSVVVAALFALHPLRVESVAWVTERKDVLSGCFGLVALICYARYAQRRMQKAEGRTQNPATRNTQHATRFTFHSSTYYLLSLFFFSCGLMSKATLVTWPFVMLLLDYWPLGRLQKAAPPGTLYALRSTLLRLVNEKIPFFVLSGVSCFLTYSTEKDAQGTAGFDQSPALLRLENALAAYIRYLGKTFWPAKLAVPYVNPGHWSWLEVGGSVLVLVGVCLAVLWLGRRRPYLLVGWCWFLGTMIPVIGLTKGWGSFMSDRFTYLPSIGVLVLTVWGVCELVQGKSEVRSPTMKEQPGAGLPNSSFILHPSLLGGAAIVLCLALTRQQLGHWKNSETLFRHVLEVTKGNVVAHNDLGNALLKDGQIDEAIRQYQEALHLKADYAEAHYNLGVALDQKGQMDEAIRHYQEAIRVKPAYADAHNNLGIDLYQQGHTGEAIRQFQEALRLKPDHAQILHNLEHALGVKAPIEEVNTQLQESLRPNPDHAATNR